MAITRSSVLNNAANELGVTLANDKIPSVIHPEINLVYPVNVKYSYVAKQGNSSATGTTTIYTTPRDKDFYLTFVSITFKHDAACDGTQIYFNITIDGLQTLLIRRYLNTGVAGADAVIVALPYPIKCDRNTAIEIVGTFAAGTQSKAASIAGFILE